ncbi:Lpp/OprI family alanine-zipper lipoprotein [Thalassotalea sp. ND16A]|uniref:Lpp/OprI family alanine-zipper lipoprotein n=1 Tax=Thalassotalea sp. ND16A TaxID=1535422 RepID=UPI00051A1790|nr:Lpp/OprI family alanine-zipper lipoprotein [Thalassotalea sp. ND16A]KGJ89213.1 hypothetical protein ND16A_2106 [Thalassotalea sp. ND16A]
MNKKLITLSGVVLALGLTGCANNDELNRNIADLNTKVDSLSMQVNKLSSDHAAMKAATKRSAADAAAAKEMAAEAAAEASKANERLDMVVSSYKK